MSQAFRDGIMDIDDNPALVAQLSSRRYIIQGDRRIKLESKDEILRRIDEAAKFVPLEQLALSPQCGFSSTVHGNAIQVESQARKLRLVLDVAREVWGA